MFVITGIMHHGELITESYNDMTNDVTEFSHGLVRRNHVFLHVLHGKFESWRGHGIGFERRKIGERAVWIVFVIIAIVIFWSDTGCAFRIFRGIFTQVFL